jgi:hypothetical protein
VLPTGCSTPQEVNTLQCEPDHSLYLIKGLPGIQSQIVIFSCLVLQRVVTWKEFEAVKGGHLSGSGGQHRGFDDSDRDSKNRASPRSAHVCTGHLCKVEALWEAARVNAYTAEGAAEIGVRKGSEGLDSQENMTMKSKSDPPEPLNVENSA